MPRSEEFTVVALLAGPPSPYALWTLFRLSGGPWTLKVVQATGAKPISKVRRLRRLVREIGIVRTMSRFMGAELIGKREDREQLRILDGLFDGEFLRSWWERSDLRPLEVPYLNHEDTVSSLQQMDPDIIIRVSGGILKREVFSVARHAALNIHHGLAPRIRGMWSIPWGIIEGRADWIGATVHLIDAGIDTGRVLWTSMPQIAPGDRGVDLFFRAHLEIVEGLLAVVQRYAEGGEPLFVPVDHSGQSSYRSAPGLGEWLKYLGYRRGEYAPLVLERGLRC